MKERVTCLLLSLLLASLVLFSGCFSKVKEIDEINGPTWVTSLTMPLVTRNVEEGYEIRLGDAPNDQGEEGLGLTGNSLYSYKPDDEEELPKWEETLDTVEVELETIIDINLGNSIPGSVNIPAGAGVDVELTDTDLAGVKLSNHHSEGAYNDITITLTNGSAGPEGLHFSLVDYEGGVAGDDVIESPVTIPEGDTTGHLNLSGADIPPKMYITVEGAVEATAPNAGITFTGSTLEIAAVTFSGEKSGALFGLEETIDLGEIDLGEDLPMITLETASLEFVHDFPDNIQVTAKLVVEGRDESGGTMVSRDLYVTLPGTGSTKEEFKDDLNGILDFRPSSLAFSFTDIDFSPITGDSVEVELGGEISLEVTPEIGFETITTDPEEMEVPEDIKKNPLQAFMMYLNVANNSPAGFDLTVHLSPDPIPLDDDNENKVEISFSVEPAVSGEPGVFDNTDAPIILTTAQLDYLTSGDLFYNQIEFTNKSEPGVILDDHYIEIRSWARVDVLVNKKEEEE